MPEIPLNFPRVWVEFDDPTDPENIFRCDLTWLTSYWNCIYGAGCQGIKKDRAVMGCCALGAHFSDKKDEKRTAKYVEMLTPETWQNYKIAKKKGWVDVDSDGDRHTARHKGGCIFQNQPDFPAGGGCALHHLAARIGKPISQVKPDVCWQLPIRRDFEWRKLEDDTKRFVITIEEYTRAGWGPGGHDLHWYCSSNTEAHNAAQPVYITERDTLIELMGQAGYDILVKHCDARILAVNAARRAAASRKSPAEVRAILNGMAVHPADPIDMD